MVVVDVSFHKVATYDRNRFPQVRFNKEVKDWLYEGNFRDWHLICGSRVENGFYRFTFQDESDAILFKLTFC